MENDIRFEVAEFDSVWNRVTRANAETARPKPAVYSDRDTLKSLIAAEVHDCAYYTQLARKCGRDNAVILRMAADERNHSKKLAVEYYLLTGEYYSPSDCSPLLECRNTALRIAYLDENEACSRYLNEAEHTKNADLAELYRELACDELRHAKTIRRIADNTVRL